MTVQARTLLEAAYAANAQTTQFTSGAGARTIIDKYTVTNVTAAPVTYAANVVASGGAAGASNVVLQTRSILAGETYPCPELVGQILEPGDFVSTIAGAANSLVHRASGRIVS